MFWSIADHFTFRDILDEAASMSRVLCFPLIQLKRLLCCTLPSILLSCHLQVVKLFRMAGMEMNAVDFMNTFGAIEVNYDFPRPLSVHAGVNALNSILRHVVSNDCRRTARSMNRNNRANELFNALRLAACKSNNLGWSPSLALTTGK